MRTKKMLSGVFLIAAVSAAGFAGEKPAAKFTTAPSAKKAGDKIVISFTVSTETDVAVYILNAKGNVVRHLAAGMLGKKPPAPLKPGLSQKLEWDGKDDVGEPAKGGPFKVRVAAGMRPKHDGFLFEKPDAPYAVLGTVHGIGVKSDGGIYAVMHRAYIRQTGTYEVQCYTRDGQYDGTLLPFGGHLSARDVSGMMPLRAADGRALLRFVSHHFRVIPYLPKWPPIQTPFVDKEDSLRMVVRKHTWRGSHWGITNIGPDGKIGGGSFTTDFKYSRPIGGYGDLELGVAQSGVDPGALLVCGVNKGKGREKDVLHAVFRVPLAGGELKAVFGDPESSGKDGSHLADPMGLAVDGKGNVYVADTGNDRVVVFEEKSGRHLADIPVPKPYWVGVHRPSGAVYVHSAPKGVGEVLKFASFKDKKVGARLALPAPKTWPRKGRARLWVLALDSNAKPPRLWMGQCGDPNMLRMTPKNQLCWCDDLGAKFSDIEAVKHTPGPKWRWALTTDPTHRYVMYENKVIDDHTGEIREAKRARGTLKLGPDGLVYALPNAGTLKRYTLDGKEVPYKAVKPGNWVYRRDEKGRPYPFREMKAGEKGHIPGSLADDKVFEWPAARGGLPICPSGTSGCERDFTIDRKGNIYVKNRSRYYHGQMTVDVYDKDGKYLRTAVWECSDGAYGPRLDAAGNMYMVEGVVRPEGNVPDPLKSVTFLNGYYGSLVKFGPEGGAFFLRTPEKYEHDFGFKRPQLDMKKEQVTLLNRSKPVKDRTMVGAKWWRPGFSVYQSVVGGDNCHCFGHLFDTDDFGRSFFPDALQGQIAVVDAAGNKVLRFGSYGNRDNRGPHSWVRDPKTKVLRPRKKDDPEDLVSPYAKPEIAFAYLNSVAVTDRNIYALDSFNNRLMRIRLEYAADSTVKIR
ncbi:MAG: hypothetical protein ACYTGB_06395 [Planctomycetota bacterium]|jgi:hypothetical protein